MKIIHCADLHLDSKMSANLDNKKSKERKIELLSTFKKMIEYASANDVRAIIIAGDLFDKKAVAKTASNTVYQAMIDNPDIVFYYLKGNHDEDNFLDDVEDIPENLKLFNDDWTTYKLGDEGKIAITGVNLSEKNKDRVFNELILNGDDYNIVTLHGQESAAQVKDKTEIIPIKLLKNRGIDYLALGHVHAFKEAELDKRGVYCYCGCLEGRGFDECGEKGFVLLDINEADKTCKREFVPIAKRLFYTLEVDVSGLNNSEEICNRISSAIKKNSCSKESLLKIILTGEVDAFCEKDVDYILKQYEDDFYFVKIYDETRLKVSYEDFRLDESLKGEFVRLVLAEKDLPEDEKAEIIRYGINILSGEEV